MKTHTNDFKTEIKKFGRQLDNKITYTSNGSVVELGNEQLNSITPHYEGSILKSVMKQLDIDSNNDIPLGTIVNYKFGIKTRDSKNLIPITNQDFTIKNVRFKAQNNGHLLINGTANSLIAGTDFVNESYFPIELEAGTYTFSRNTVNSNVSMGLVLSNGTTSLATLSRASSNLYVTFTINSAFKCYLYFYISNGYVVDNYDLAVMLEKGPTRTTYEPYSNYDYVDFGNYVVYKSEKQEDTKSYKITCYDKMLYSMVDYESLGITYPITIKNYLSAICTKLGLTFKNASDTFANYDKQILNELYLDSDGNSLDYTFRDVLDEIAGATGSTICIDKDDKLEVRYITDTSDTIDEQYLKDINVNFGEKYGPINSIVLSRSAESDNVYLRDEESVEDDGLCEIKIKDNQILNGNNRSDFLQDLLDVLDGLEYYVNDFTSTGIVYYDLCDMYNVSIDNNTYSCVMFNNEVDITQGLVEQIYTEMPEESETDYKKADKTDRKIKEAYIIVDKQNGEINSVVQNVNTLNQMVNSQGNQIDALGTRITQNVNSITASITTIQGEIENGVPLVKTSSVTIDDNGLNVSTDTSKISTTMTNNTFEIKDSGNTTLAYFGYDENEGISKATMDNLTVENYFIAGVHRVEEFDNDTRTGWFYIGG